MIGTKNYGVVNSVLFCNESIALRILDKKTKLLKHMTSNNLEDGDSPYIVVILQTSNYVIS